LTKTQTGTETGTGRKTGAEIDHETGAGIHRQRDSQRETDRCTQIKRRTDRLAYIQVDTAKSRLTETRTGRN